ncbi:rhomboid family intramembrane serine protease [Rhodobacteraceae bacterium N5(2021)]|uniref:Rhomboid family intramembrane serine protease n=1 Tax=Gymnodinialimonas phycosphaerae TaxID=2841589 RepID=A0A975U0H7_9RHOB|nr:rhomboid family intramembrane serine protease [Gymnodinialimonas phycosphaerae]MBY4895367.1 rhomboid family intramembrane serine protease [Gymnodinialimonas phycosphaerae]
MARARKTTTDEAETLSAGPTLPSSAPLYHPSAPWLLATMVALMSIVELGLLGSDYGLWGSSRLRQSAYEWYGFWPGLLQGWDPNYTLQPYTMFLSYAGLHGGPGHLAMNMITLWSLGAEIIARVGRLRFIVLYLGTAIGGAAGYGLLATTIQPMVGASGALFGLAGGLMAWAYVDRFTARAGLWPIARVAALLIAINIAMYWALDGQLAWQTHLGGFLAGWVLAMLIDPRGRPADP